MIQHPCPKCQCSMTLHFVGATTTRAGSNEGAELLIPFQCVSCGHVSEFPYMHRQTDRSDPVCSPGPTAPLHFDLTLVNFESSQYRQFTEHLVRKWAHVVPRWCRFLEIKDVGSLDGGICKAWSRPRYHLAGVEVTGRWFTADDVYREVAIVHELTHIAHGRWIDLFEKRILQFVKSKSEDVAVYFEKDFDEIMEDVTQHLAVAISGAHPSVPKVRLHPGAPRGVTDKDLLNVYLKHQQ